MTDPVTVELKPCPICGDSPVRNGRGRVGGVLCTGIGQGREAPAHRVQTYGSNQAEADAAWNARASPSREPGEDETVCTDCRGTGVTIQTERRCACQLPLDPPSASSGPAKDDLARLIETRLLGVAPDAQDLVLEDHDWRLIIAALTLPEQPRQAETGWLIETKFGPHIHYLGLGDPRPSWTRDREFYDEPSSWRRLAGIIRLHKDANDAIRFARKADAEQLVEALGQLLIEPAITEHMWPVDAEQPRPVDDVESMLPKRCDGKEQYAFEEYAKASRYDMTEHPLHYLFMDEKTDAARQAWCAGLKYATDIARAALGHKDRGGE